MDEQDFLDIVDQLRVAIPEEMKQAQRVNMDRERVMGNAQTEAEKVVMAAQEQAAFMLQDNEVIKLSEKRAQAILDDAKRQAEEVRAGADTYAFDVLNGLENELNRLLAQVRRGRATLERTTSNNGPATDSLQPRSMPSGKASMQESYRVIE